MEPNSRQPALSWRTVSLTVLFAVLGALWIRKASLLAFTILVGEGTPPVPALTALVLLAAVGFAWHALTRGGRWRREALLVYLSLTTCFVTVDANGIRQLLASTMSLRYFAAPENDYQSYADLLPAWVAPTDEGVVRRFFEGGEGAGFPWRAWAAPVLMWSGAFLVLTLSLMCMGALFRGPWAEHERLAFPLAELALRLAPDPPERPLDQPLLRSPLFWVGVGVAAIYDGSNIAHAFSPQVPAIGQVYDFNRLLTERPWTGLQPISMPFRPEIVGLGYLVPVDVLLSVWAFFLLFRFEGFFAGLAGYSIGGFPFEAAQGVGAYVALAGFLLWAARRSLAAVVRSACGGPRRDDREEAMAEPLALWGTVAGLALMTAFCMLMGVSPLRALGYMVLLYGCSLVYMRVRAQTGLPITYVVPREDMHWTIQALVPTNGRLSRAEMRSETAFTVLQALCRMTFPQLASYELEGFRIGDRARIRQGHIAVGLVLGLVLGLGLAYTIHLHAAHDYGWNVIDGGTTEGGFRTVNALTSYAELESRIRNRTPLPLNTNVARLVGLALTLAMVLLRARFLRFPLNPLGLAIAGTFGHSVWFAIFVAWLWKTLILRLGGAHTYRQLTPLFIGVAMGHFLIAGGIWGLVGAFSEDVARRYLLWFA